MRNYINSGNPPTHFTFKIRTNNIRNVKIKVSNSHVPWFKKKRNKKQTLFVIWSNRTWDCKWIVQIFRLSYIFCPRINKIFYILYSGPTEICIITASTSEWIVRRGTALYNLQKKDGECVWRHVDQTDTHQQRETMNTTSRGKKYTSTQDAETLD